MFCIVFQLSQWAVEEDRTGLKPKVMFGQRMVPLLITVRHYSHSFEEVLKCIITDLFEILIAFAVL